MRTCLRLCLSAMALAILSGCNSPSYRIKRNPELFASFPVDVQEKVRKGAIDIGYSENMVEMALGKPNRHYRRKTAMGGSEVWSYTGTYTSRDRQRVEGRFRVRDSSGRFRTVHDSIWVDVDREHEYERLRVEFRDGKVFAIEEVER